MIGCDGGTGDDGGRRHVVAGAVLGVGDTAGTLLLAQRDRPAAVAGLWELPGGKVEAGETDAQALHRELVEELGVQTEVGGPLAGQVILSAELVLVARWARIVDGEPVAHDHRALRWVDGAELSRMADAGELVPADTGWVPELVAALTL
ncbi:(deoxy)nucleoside triphosphate pyrophosphohydrolase [Gordonia sp. NPDC003376]